MANGLDSAIVDVNDDELMRLTASARILMNKEIYADSYVDLFKAPRYKVL